MDFLLHFIRPRISSRGKNPKPVQKKIEPVVKAVKVDTDIYRDSGPQIGDCVIIAGVAGVVNAVRPGKIKIRTESNKTVIASLRDGNYVTRDTDDIVKNG